MCSVPIWQTPEYKYIMGNPNMNMTLNYDAHACF